MLFLDKLSLVSHYHFLQDKFESSSADIEGFLLPHSYLTLFLSSVEQTPYERVPLKSHVHAYHHCFLIPSHTYGKMHKVGAHIGYASVGPKPSIVPGILTLLNE